jgi:hypothetical protein
MTPTDYRTLYQLLRRYQINQQPGSKVYNAADIVLTELFPHYYNQNQEQER